MKKHDLTTTDPDLLGKLSSMLSTADMSFVLETLQDLCQDLKSQSTMEQFKGFLKKHGQKAGTYKLWIDFVHRDAPALLCTYYYLSIWTGNWNHKLQHWRWLVHCFMPFDWPLYLHLIPGHLADVLQVLPAVLDHLCKAALWWGLRGGEDSTLLWTNYTNLS